jgi:NADPH-dependent 2,4-dienoyl-CoA reductase/sulfur reductase-like enzyme
VAAWDVLAGKAFVGSRVAIVGGGMVGAETAEYLADRYRNVTVFEMLDTIEQSEPYKAI